MNPIKLVILICVLCESTYSLAEEAASSVQPLLRDEGYLLLDLNIERPVSEIEFRKYVGNSSELSNAYDDRIRLGPFPVGRHLRIIRLERGRYSWTRTSVPHFDLPFRLDTSEDDRWEFQIRQRETGYLGQLVVRKDRSSNAVSVDLLNRIAATHEELRERFRSVIAKHPLYYAGRQRDDFASWLFTRQPETADP